MPGTTRVAIIGAGPAGLTAGYLLSKAKVAAHVLEADPEYVGGISRTARYKGFHFDIGGHRFFSKSREVEDFWTEILPDDMLERPRSSRIYYGGNFFAYPLKGFEALQKLGPIEAARCITSYAYAKAFPTPNPKSFEDWTVNQFGRRLYEIFFKTYTEKVWGMSCKEISADWAAQRIKGLYLGAAIWHAIVPQKKPKTEDRGAVIKTLIDSFRYPRKGPGMLWEVCAEKMKKLGGQLTMGRMVTGASWDANTKRWTVTHKGPDGQTDTLTAEHLISSAPLRQLTLGLSPQVSEASRAAADKLRYRDFITVALILKDRQLFDDNWIYIHDPKVKVGRVQNFKSWSPEMSPDPTLCCYGLEYFCFEGDGVWTAKDEDLIAQAKEELEQIGLAKGIDVLDGCVVRQQKAYPVYDDDYAARVELVRTELEEKFPTLHPVGRNGMHKYNNQDHAMMTAMLTAQNIIAGNRALDPWKVNEDAQYHEAGAAGAESTSGLRAVPKKL
ncbi:MAG: NAD(P)/FAD-dependent oxidoreductase [Deltaproteobacteria bacterium]|nr:NAD(P)/FAD-dependent oxidoreductase [Deltaproteobacteria bacterium]